ncbi:N-acetylmuramoyl-L-alanine amidase [Oceanobacillus senegalensis]|uniref:N-acetylmuramoyl-L-alanine amidase n=1 Tax=Oceanobacillus senegalensis TaxID=1936063 RepID=UPI000A307F81|nr:N-acetylmuramoyl-L-alanine amidase [Oceanobacillus senegalensis]
MKLYLDPGHGGKDPGAQGNSLQEKHVTLDIAKRIHSILSNEYEGIQIKMSRTSDTSKCLNKRTNEANSWGADYFVSIHCNAFNGKAKGYEDYIYSELSDSSLTSEYQNIMHEEITKLNQLSVRRKKKANFHVLRETKMAAFLSENGFIDNDNDANFMKQASWRQKVARGHVNGIARAFHLKKKDEINPITLYMVIVGSFDSKENADTRVSKLQEKGIKAFVEPIMISNKHWYRVQAGAFYYKENAEAQVDRLENAGFKAFIWKA